MQLKINNPPDFESEIISKINDNEKLNNPFSKTINCKLVRNKTEISQTDFSNLNSFHLPYKSSSLVLPFNT